MRSRSFHPSPLTLTAVCASLAAGTLLASSEAAPDGRTDGPRRDDQVTSDVSFAWPVEDAVAAQVYAASGWHGKGWKSYAAGIDVHTGVDVRPAWAGPYDYTVAVRAAAEGWVERIVGCGPRTRGTGNTVILRHANGRYSLYAHLDGFTRGLAVGMFVAQGDVLGIMGSSGYTRRGAGITHVHFEIKNHPTLFDEPGLPRHVGYTPGHPDYYGYEDPRAYIDGISEEPISTLAVVVSAPGPIEVRGSPGETYLQGAATAVNDHIAPGQTFLAFRRAFAEGRFWYFIDLPSTKPAPAESGYPTRGPTGGWIDGDLVTTGATVMQIGIRSKIAIARTCPDRRCAPLASMYEGQRFAPSETAAPGHGCGRRWHRIALPGSAGAAEGWVCGARMENPP